MFTFSDPHQVKNVFDFSEVEILRRDHLGDYHVAEDDADEMILRHSSYEKIKLCAECRSWNEPNFATTEKRVSGKVVTLCENCAEEY